MKKTICIILALAAVFSLCACSDGEGKTSTAAAANSVQSVMEQQMKSAEDSSSAAQPAQTAVPKAAPEKVYTGVDVDLTQLSSTMVYSEVYDMMAAPQDYIGKTVRMNGMFALYQAVDMQGELIPEQIYFACVIADATACCSQGIEFVLAGDYVFPDDYPELGSEICVAGVFDTYDEDGRLYCHLTDAVFE